MKRNKRKLFVEAFPLLGDAPSGVGKLLYSMIDALLRKKSFTDNYELTLIVSLGKKSRLDKWNFGPEVKVKELPLPLKVINALDRFHLMFPIDLICGKGTYLFPNYRRLPLVKSSSLTYIHDVAYLVFPETIQERNLSFLRRAVPRAIKRSSRVLTLSKQSADELRSAFPKQKGKISIVPAGVDRKLYSVDESASREILSQLGVEPRKYILFVGNIEPRKNIGYLLDIYAELKKDPQYQDFALVLIGGDGWRNEALTERIAHMNAQGYRIIRPSVRVPDSELPVLYQQAFVTALMAIHEGFGMTPLEALSATGRVVVSDIPVLHEVGGNAVSYAPLADVTKAALVFEKTGKDAWNKKEAERQLGFFTWKRAAEDLIKIINEIQEESHA